MAGLINCFDCSREVSSSAYACPHCGSRDLFGQTHADRHTYQLRPMNDYRLMLFALGFGALGSLYGFVSSHGLLSVTFFILFYGVLGLCAGAGFGFCFNLLRRIPGALR